MKGVVGLLALCGFIAIAANSCDSSSNNSPSDSTATAPTWPISAAAEEMVKEETGSGSVACEYNVNDGGNETDYICVDKDFGNCYFVWHTGPLTSGTVHMKPDEVC